jgi:hypothetical protein
MAVGGWGMRALRFAKDFDATALRCVVVRRWATPRHPPMFLVQSKRFVKTPDEPTPRGARRMRCSSCGRRRHTN